MKTLREIVSAVLPPVQDGQLAHMPKSGDQIRLEHIHDTPHGPQATVRRAIPKVKGKAARKADRKARRARRFV